MVSNDANGHPPEPGAAPGLVDDALLALEQRLDRASAAAERLLADAVTRIAAEPGAADEPESTAGTRRTPASGYQAPAGAPDRGLLGDDGDLLLALLHSLRDRIPPDLQRRLAEAVREVLLALRALIDWYLERSDRRRGRPAEVRDIPIL